MHTRRPASIHRLAVIAMILCLLSGCTRRPSYDTAQVPGLPGRDWDHWWSEVTAAAGLPSDGLTIQRTSVERRGAPDEVWQVDAMLPGKPEKQRTTLIWLRGSGSTLEVRRTYIDGTIPGLSPTAAWGALRRLPLDAWPHAEGELELRPMHPNVQYRASSAYSLHSWRDGKWIAHSSEEPYHSGSSDWEFRIRRGESTAFWVWSAAASGLE